MIKAERETPPSSARSCVVGSGTTNTVPLFIVSVAVTLSAGSNAVAFDAGPQGLYNEASSS
jgi:hypothetical protein